MNVHQHALISGLAGLLIGLVSAPEMLIEVTASALIFGTLIDLDHFPISRAVHGEWLFLEAILRNPIKATYNVQEVVDSSEEFPERYRYLSHGIEHLIVLALGIYTGNILLYAGAFATGLHLFSDIYSDMYMW